MNKVGGWWSRYFLTLELAAAILIFLSVLVWGEFFAGKVVLDQVLGVHQNRIYENLTAVFGTLLGFVITAVSIVLGYTDNENLGVIRESDHYEDLWKVYKSAMRSLAFATAAGLLGVIFENIESVKYYLIYLNILTISLVVFRLGRSIWILENIISLVTLRPRVSTLPRSNTKNAGKTPKKSTPKRKSPQAIK
jgi:hypothetical protein